MDRYEVEWLRNLHAVMYSDPEIHYKVKQQLYMALVIIPKRQHRSRPRNEQLIQARVIIDNFYHIKVADMPILKDEYSLGDKAKVSRAIRKLYKSFAEGHKHKAFCYKYMYFKSGQPNKNKKSTNKINCARLVLAAHRADVLK